jgi:type I restriction enzyme S subunit
MDAIAKMPTYEAYKDSGVEWLGEIPAHWPSERAKWLFKRAERPVQHSDEIVTCFRDGTVTLRKNRRLDGFTNAMKEHGYQGIRKGDLVIHAMDAFAGAIGVSDSDGKATPVYAACVPRIENSVNPDFYAYFIRDMALSGFITSLAKGIRERSTDFRFADFAELELPFPLLEEQTLIANFLDQKTAQIDEAIAIKEQQIALLKERKQIIIQKAVTQGLNPDAPMKDSGVDWIGEIPEHWEVSKIKNHIDILPGFAFKSEAYSSNEDDIPLLRGVNVAPGSIKWIENVYWPRDRIKNFEKYCLNEGDIVIAMDRPWISSGIRVSRLSQCDVPSLLLQRVARIRGHSTLLTDYVMTLLSTKLFRDYFEPMLTGISVPHISPEQIQNFVIPIPSIESQNRILEYIFKESSIVDEVIELTSYQIEKLKEYKTTLINSAVTGKIRITPDMVA